jgi:pyridoxamine 5'-phosphate oxidase
MQLRQNPNAALLFFWPEIERQIRIEGRTVRISRKKSVEYFRLRPLESRISAIVSPQSQVIPDRLFLDSIREGVLLDLGSEEPPCPDQWGGYDLKPRMIEFWQGRKNRLHDRIRYRKSGDAWTAELLAP